MHTSDLDICHSSSISPLCSCGRHYKSWMTYTGRRTLEFSTSQGKAGSLMHIPTLAVVERGRHEKQPVTVRSYVFVARWVLGQKWQSIVTQNSKRAEFVVLSLCIKESLWLCNLAVTVRKVSDSRSAKGFLKYVLRKITVHASQMPKTAYFPTYPSISL